MKKKDKTKKIKKEDKKRKKAKTEKEVIYRKAK